MDDSHAETPHDHDELLPLPQRIAVFIAVVLPFLGLIAAVVLLWGRGFGWLEVGLLVGMYSITVIGVTVGFHRLFTHRSFETVAPIRILLAIAGSMSLQGPVIKWCAVHRRHHQCSDHEGDPHSPHHHGGGLMGTLRGMFYAHMGWLVEKDPPNIGRSVKDLVDDRALMFIDRTFLVWVVMGVLLPMGVGYFVTGSAWGLLTGFIWGGLVRIFVMHHVTWSINSVCHVWGARPFKSNDHSRNNAIFGILGFGEGWHNNHHAFPTSARHGLRWWQFDLSWIFIQTLRMFRLAWNVRTPNPAALAAKSHSAT